MIYCTVNNDIIDWNTYPCKENNNNNVSKKKKKLNTKFFISVNEKNKASNNII